MSNTHSQSRKVTYFLIRLSLITLLLGSCSRSQQLGVQDDPQEILNNKLRDPEVILTPEQSITLLNHCAELGEQHAASATEKTVSIFAGNTGAGRSTTLNALLGCQMKAVKPRELGLPGIKKIVIVDPESPRKEVMPIGHGWHSQTFMPQIVPTPDEPNSAYCDCPGFYDTRGAEINIANAINIRKVLQQARGVKAVFLVSYAGLSDDRGSSIRNVEVMCHQMFGGADNLRKYQSSVLLGITKAPIYVGGEPLTQSTVRELLTDCDSPIAQILADRVFLFDPLDRAIDNPDFWSLAQCRNTIARLPAIPQRSAITLFQTTLTDSDRRHLLNTVRQLKPKLVDAITEGDAAALGQHWQLLQRLQVIEHPEIGQLMEDEIVSDINNALLKQVDSVRSSANVFNFYDAQQRLDKLTTVVSQLPNVPLVCNIDEIRRHISTCEANQPPQAILDHKCHNPEAVLTPNQSITLLNYCTELGEQNAATATEKTVSIFAGNTGAGKSTTINALLGCQMKAEIDEFGEQRIVVNPESPRKEVMPIGHGRQSQTFLPQIIPTPDESNGASCDCPGFADTRGAEINIANAINIRKVLQQATGVKAVFLVSYAGLSDDRGSSIRNVEAMCHQMFGSADNLRKYQSSVLLGITKAPRYTTSGQPLSISSIRLRLNASNNDIAQILADRVFLFDPLDRATDNPDFWSLAQCRKEIAQLPVIPQRSAITLFQTTLTDGDRRHLLATIRQLRPRLVNAITQGDVTALGQHWQLLQCLRIIEHPEVEQLVEGQVLLAINVALRQFGDIGTWTNTHNFDQAEAHIALFTQLIQELPGAILDINPDELRQQLARCRGQYEEDKKRDEAIQRLREKREAIALEIKNKERKGECFIL